MREIFADCKKLEELEIVIFLLLCKKLQSVDRFCTRTTQLMRNCRLKFVELTDASLVTHTDCTAKKLRLAVGLEL